MHVIHDLAVASELVEDAEGVHEAFDGLARPLQAIGPQGHVSFVLFSPEPAGDEVRERVARYYLKWAARHPFVQAEITDIQEFIASVANDEVTE